MPKVSGKVNNPTAIPLARRFIKNRTFDHPLSQFVQVFPLYQLKYETVATIAAPYQAVTPNGGSARKRSAAISR
jgi:hypothetical protein